MEKTFTDVLTSIKQNLFWNTWASHVYVMSLDSLKQLWKEFIYQIVMPVLYVQIWLPATSECHENKYKENK